MKEKIFSGLITVIILALAGTYLFSMISCLNKPKGRDDHDRALLSQVKFQQVFELNRGFYKDCSFIVEERKDYWYFSGTITKCAGNPDVILSPVSINARDFVDNLETIN